VSAAESANTNAKKMAQVIGNPWIG